MISQARGDRYLVEGPVTLATVQALLDEGSRRFEGERSVVDFSGVTEADSSAVSLMLEWPAHAHARSARISLYQPRRESGEPCQLYGVTDLIPVAAAVAAAP